MANDFSADARIVEFWRFENNCLAGKNGNFLSDASGQYNSSTPLEGTYSYSLNGTTGYGYRPDAYLTAGFPLKNGDAVKKISVACWIKPTDFATQRPIFSKSEVNGNKRSCQRPSTIHGYDGSELIILPVDHTDCWKE